MNRPIATVGQRVGAAVIDAALPLVVFAIGGGILVVVEGVFGAPIANELLIIASAVLIGGWLVAQSAAQAGRGSLGMRLCGVRLVGSEDLRPISVARALLRLIVFLVLCCVIIGFFTVLLDRSGRRQGWHDRVTRTVMVQRPARTPVTPLLAHSDRRASQWLAGMSDPSATDPAALEAMLLAAVDHHLATTDPPVRHDEMLAEDIDLTTERGQVMRDRVAPPAVPLVAPPASAHEEHAHPGAVGPIGSTTHAAGPEDAAGAAASVPTDSAAVAGVRAVATLVWDDGTRYRVYSRTVFGRNPLSAQRSQIAAIADSTMSLSKTHFEISRAGHARAEIIDLHSTNGVRLRRGRQARLLPPGEPVALATGDVIEIGQRHARVEVAV